MYNYNFVSLKFDYKIIIKEWINGIHLYFVLHTFNHAVGIKLFCVDYLHHPVVKRY